MVQFTQIALGVAVAMISIGEVAAKSCVSGGIYCGPDLLNRGDYITKIITNLRAQDYPTDENTINKSLWNCLEHGDISLAEICAIQCQGGDSNDDYCIEDSASVKKRFQA